MIVVKPVMSSISEGCVIQHPPIQVTCTEYEVKTDKNGVHEVTKVSFNLRGPDLSALGSVCVHFRHTTRLVQVQGSAKMPNRTTAAIWFTENVLNERFQKLAKKKQFDIEAFNSKVLEMLRKHHNSLNNAKFCYQCERLFTPSSKPTQCLTCHHYVHKACLRPHSVSCKPLDHVSSFSPPPASRPTKRLRPDESQVGQLTPSQRVSPTTSAIMPFISSLTSSLINSGVSTFTGNRTSITFVPNVEQLEPVSSSQVFTSSVSSVTTSNTPISISSSAINTCTSSSSFTSLVATVASCMSSLSPRMSTAPSYTGAGPCTSLTAALPSFPCTASAGTTQSSTRPPRTKQGPKKQISETAESVQIDYLTTELNYTHSKIVNQDNTIKDLEFKVKILEEKLKVSEDKLNSDLHSKYFGMSSCTQPHPSYGHCTCCGHPSPSSASPRCQSSLPTQAARTSPSVPEENYSFLIKTISELKVVVDALKDNILNLPSIISRSSKSSLSPVSRSPTQPVQNQQSQYGHNIPGGQIIVEAEVHQSVSLSSTEVENISIDEFVPDPGQNSSAPLPSRSSNHLNSQVLTI